jgi:hypothetical protein
VRPFGQTKDVPTLSILASRLPKIDADFRIDALASLGKGLRRQFAKSGMIVCCETTQLEKLPRLGNLSNRSHIVTRQEFFVNGFQSEILKITHWTRELKLLET